MIAANTVHELEQTDQAPAWKGQCQGNFKLFSIYVMTKMHDAGIAKKDIFND
jgi:hypothetical protein